MTASTVDLHVRPYRDADEPAVLDLLLASLGPGPTGARTPAFFRWKHLENPFGRSVMLVAETGGKLVGLRAFMRWELRRGERTVRAVRAVDTATHPDFQGRGIFARLTADALSALEGDADLVFNTPNEKSGPGYLKLGWRQVGRVPIAVRVRRPLRIAAAAARRGTEGDPGPAPEDGEGAPAGEVLAEPGLQLSGAVGGPAPGLATPRTAAYLRWRYGPPGLAYRAVVEEGAGDTRGLAVYRIRPRGRLWETMLVELLSPSGDPGAGRALIRRVVRAAPVDHVTCHFPPRSPAARAARRAGFLPAPGGPTLMVRPVAPDVGPDAWDRRSWALSLGDVELF